MSTNYYPTGPTELERVLLRAAGAAFGSASDPSSQTPVVPPGLRLVQAPCIVNDGCYGTRFVHFCNLMKNMMRLKARPIFISFDYCRFAVGFEQVPISFVLQ